MVTHGHPQAESGLTRSPVLVGVRTLQGPAPGRRTGHTRADRRHQKTGGVQLQILRTSKDFSGNPQCPQGRPYRLSDWSGRRACSGKFFGRLENILQFGCQIPDDNSFV
ncbi:unnamed protein product [Acanthoscelides obtectus]|uniref:Uncharacterized protein n=1 Tax=Acanthoscelides obtectus TaxID=200917 RepID=A0A9P0M6T8_ACAOB|nr:unnamed protein product [Acanthoscelides obtectus]CAH2010242.1 unnamed protein product [Acanthoscelides obtectus]CAK1631146.1 hypothetical protein AOBTE_LOCUS6782 [Acanthoscelides obtectus]CAK1682792.1 hypothetical protein AOBTE_LOCUS33886 [Acanthoscelides obtectus]